MSAKLTLSSLLHAARFASALERERGDREFNLVCHIRFFFSLSQTVHAVFSSQKPAILSPSSLHLNLHVQSCLVLSLTYTPTPPPPTPFKPGTPPQSSVTIPSAVLTADVPSVAVDSAELRSHRPPAAFIKTGLNQFKGHRTIPERENHAGDQTNPPSFPRRLRGSRSSPPHVNAADAFDKNRTRRTMLSQWTIDGFVRHIVAHVDAHQEILQFFSRSSERTLIEREEEMEKQTAIDGLRNGGGRELGPSVCVRRWPVLVSFCIKKSLAAGVRTRKTSTDTTSLGERERAIKADDPRPTPSSSFSFPPVQPLLGAQRPVLLHHATTCQVTGDPSPCGPLPTCRHLQRSEMAFAGFTAAQSRGFVPRTKDTRFHGNLNKLLVRSRLRRGLRLLG